MRLSDAAVLVASITEMCAGDWAGCFIGAAANAVGLPEVIRGERDSVDSFMEYNPMARVDAVRDYWPWLGSNGDEAMLKIITLWDMSCMTFGELVAYVRTIEPPCGFCNVYDCCCERTLRLEVEIGNIEDGISQKDSSPALLR